MKKIFSTAILMLAIQFVNAQVQTTLEEFNYVNWGLKEDEATGRGIKSGYSIQPFTFDEKLTWNNGMQRVIKLSYLIKSNENRAIIMRCSDNQGNLGYHCIPIGSSEEIWNKAYQDLTTVGSEWHLLISWALMKAISNK